MNTSANTDRVDDTTTGAARAAGTGPLRLSVAGALLATAIGAAAVGLTTTNSVDEPPPAGAATAAPVPAPVAPALRWLTGFIDRAFDPHIHCDYRFDDRFPCGSY